MKNELSTPYLVIQFEEECLIHLKSLSNLARYLTSDANEADDLLQDTLLRAYRFFHKFENKTNCKAWLFKIMKNLFINRYRQQYKHNKIVSLDNYYPDIDDNPFYNKDYDNPELNVIKDMFHKEILASLELLPQNYRRVVMLSDVHSYSYNEIAKILDCPIGTVRSRLSRGRRILRKHLFKFAMQQGILS